MQKKFLSSQLPRKSRWACHTGGTRAWLRRQKDLKNMSKGLCGGLIMVPSSWGDQGAGRVALNVRHWIMVVCGLWIGWSVYGKCLKTSRLLLRNQLTLEKELLQSQQGSKMSKHQNTKLKGIINTISYAHWVLGDTVLQPFKSSAYFSI